MSHEQLKAALTNARKRRCEKIKPFKQKAMEKIIKTLNDSNPDLNFVTVDFKDEFTELFGNTFSIYNRERAVITDHIKPEIENLGVSMDMHNENGTSIDIGLNVSAETVSLEDTTEAES
jgi:hypothetical protein